MNSSARLGPTTSSGAGVRALIENDNPPARVEPRQPNQLETGAKGATDARPRVFIAAGNRLLREALARMLTRRGGFEVLGLEEDEGYGVDGAAERVASLNIQTLLYTSRGSLEKDLTVVRRMRASVPEVKILVLGLTGDEMEFLRYVRAGIDGCLLRDATAEDVLGAVRAVHAGEAVCPGVLCSVLFRYFERENASFPSVGVHREMGLTRREQQLIPLIAKGLTNKEIANHFCLSEQTVKNHLYRMKQKIGAYDRLGIVQLCQQQGYFL